MIYDDEDNVHYMFPNEARLRNMTYGMTVHYDVEIEFVDILEPGQAPYALDVEMMRDDPLFKPVEASLDVGRSGLFCNRGQHWAPSGPCHKAPCFVQAGRAAH